MAKKRITKYQLVEAVPPGRPVTRDEAIANGWNRFFTGKACPQGHISERYVSNFRCCQCGYERQAKWIKVNRKRVNAQNKIRCELWRDRNKLKLAGRPKPHLCEACGRPGKIVWEHSHSTGKFRGWTCYKCNIILANCNDSVEILEKLIAYLKRNGG